jgi:hypothetical protein
MLKFFDADPESGIEKIKIRYPGSGMPRIRDKHPGSATRRKNVKVCKFGVARIVAAVQFSISSFRFLGKMFEGIGKQTSVFFFIAHENSAILCHQLFYTITVLNTRCET